MCHSNIRQPAGPSLPGLNAIAASVWEATGKANPGQPFQMNFKRYLNLYDALWKNSVVREMSFKGNFILWILVEVLWFGLQLSFVTVVFSQTNPSAPGPNGRWCCWWARAISSSSFTMRFS